MDIGQAAEALAMGLELVDKDGTFWRADCDGALEFAHNYGHWHESCAERLLPSFAPFNYPEPCPDCGTPCDLYWDGMCEDCYRQREHAAAEAWADLSPRQQQARIREACR